MTSKIAVASKDGISINLHFGHADVFWIYQVGLGKCQFLEKREVEKYCHGQSSNASAMTLILETIKDCDAVLTAKIGDGPREKLARIGVSAVTDYAYEAIDESLMEYLKSKQ